MSIEFIFFVFNIHPAAQHVGFMVGGSCEFFFGSGIGAYFLLRIYLFCSPPHPDTLLFCFDHHKKPHQPTLTPKTLYFFGWIFVLGLVWPPGLFLLLFELLFCSCLFFGLWISFVSIFFILLHVFWVCGLGLFFLFYCICLL